MKSLARLIPIFTFILCLGAQNIVSIQGGKIQGTVEEGVKVYKGIPFAAPPVGELRWKPPQPVVPWDTVRDASDYCLACPQPASNPESFWARDAIPYDEDCLFLNVWSTAKPDEKQAVMVWIHGGAFLDGAGSYPDYSGLYLAKKGVVVVTINYRLNVFGFLALPELVAESETNSSGNYGLMDQIAALQWVQNNIAKFGGDPNNVTIFGHSAGSAALYSLLASPLAKGLFQKAIGQSGASSYFETYPNKSVNGNKTAFEIGKQFVEQIGAESLDELRSFSDEELIAAFKKWNDSGKPRFAPIVDGYVIPEPRIDRFKEGKYNDVTLMTGVTDLEMSPMIDPESLPKTLDDYSELVEKSYGDYKDDFLKAYPAETTDEIARQWISSLSDRAFWFPMRQVLREYDKGKSDIYLYSFTYAPPHANRDYYGAFHSAEIGYVFDDFINSPNYQDYGNDYNEFDFQLKKTLSDIWVNFAKTGKPSAEGVPNWLPYNEVTQHYLEMGKTFEVKDHLRKDQVEFFEKMYKVNSDD